MKYAKSIDGSSKVLIPKNIDGYDVLEKEILDKEIDKFTMVHNRILHSKKLKQKEKITYAVLKSFCYDTDICFPTEELLKELLEGWDVKTIRKYIRTLCEFKLIAKVTGKNKAGTKRKTFYKMLPSSLWLIEQDNEVMDDWRKLNEEFEVVEEV